MSRLYSPYPQLHFPVSLLPTWAYPLTPSFPTTTAGFPTLQKAYQSVPINTHLVTPRLLLSLLATATYLGHQYLLQEVLAIVLRTVGPTTVTRYIGFAIGNGIGEEEWDSQDDEGARGMEKVARTIHSGFASHTDSDEWVSDCDSELPDIPAPSPTPRLSTDSAASDYVVKVGGESVAIAPNYESISRSVSVKSSSTVRPNDTHSLSVVDESDASILPAVPHFYGFVGNKIGEACVCWLSRYGLDVFNVEAAVPQALPGHRDLPPVWGQGGIPANLAAAVLSSDALFVPNEIERYRMARRVLDFRRAGWTSLMEEDGRDPSSSVVTQDDIDGWDEDERELSKVFADGIYYTPMTFDDLSAISSDIDPHTTLPYAPLTVLQAAHWSTADLKNRITHERVTPSAPARELGLTQSSAEISAMYARRRAGRSRMASPGSFDTQSSVSFSSLSLSSMGYQHPGIGDGLYHPVHSDDTHHIGARNMLFVDPSSTSSTVPEILGMPDMGPEWGNGDKAAVMGKTRTQPQGEKTLFGIKSGARRGIEIDAKFREEGGNTHIALPGLGKVKEEKWSKVEPYRFSCEFWGVDQLPERDRLWSATHFYAGSYYQVYISTIRKKPKNQLGIYLSRQDPKLPFPPVRLHPWAHGDESPTVRATRSGSVPFEPVTRSSSIPTSPPVGETLSRTFSASPPVVGSPGPHIEGLPDIDGGGEKKLPHEGGSSYLDPREVSRVYFSITCTSALGTALICFGSGPDDFAPAQSWGWKSAALRTEEFIPIPQDDADAILGWVGEAGDGPESGSLRCTVVVGIV